YQRGMALLARYTVFAEGTRGQLGKEVIARFNLDAGRDPQAYSIGLKEIWKVRPEVHRPGLVMHTAGWPLDRHTYGGSFIYHMADGKVAIGFTVGLNYSNPWLSPFQEFQRYKTHPAIRSFLEGGERLAYGARAMTGGGLQALPELVFPGGVLVGCEAGFLNGGRIKGIHSAIKSGMLAAAAIAPAVLSGRRHDALRDYPKAFQKSWLYRELHAVRNFKPWMEKKLKWATLMFGMDQVLFRGKAPWTLHRHVPDYIYLQPANQSKEKAYPKPDGKLTFDVSSSVYLSGTNHEEDQPVHLVLKDADKPLSFNLPKFAGPEVRYCPAGVFSYVPDGKGGMKFQINAANCLHCKTCDIKDPGQNIIWTAPQGGDGPNYPDM
ncbi:MAG: electron transfer flavoprotein-ubiquinone oxidoreductase, partial [Oxalobacter sp.]|nr:electron transfer flavoprotein-ubiquinone oxidoreductase [Oxalobacter sp.]